MTTVNSERSRFCGAYGVGDGLSVITQRTTPIRNSVEDVVTDLVAAKKQGLSLQFAQIIDLQTLEPIEALRETLARLR
ncbi:MAG: hypothetical protein QOK29_3268 [Rhodospirillaceae bacterium]|jgi:hypothetical protein|nr:hypothetical protein [Rhodospirillaceae bacterium]